MNEENKKEKRIRKKGNVIFSLLILVFCLLIGFFSLYGFFVPDREISDSENRVLAKAPVLTFNGIVDGSFMKSIETYLNDQFPFRDEAIYVKSFFERLWGKNEENGVYIGEKGFLFEKPSEYNGEKMTATAKKINGFIKKNSKLKPSFILVPDSSYVYSENLPDSLKLPNQKKQISDFYSKLNKNIACVDAVSVLLREKSDHNVFYTTDHHWTTRGAFSVFLEAAKSLEIKVKKKDFAFHTVSNSFEGTLKSKSVFQKGADSIEICAPKKSAGTYFLEISGEAGKRASLFFEEKLEEKNKYEVFLGGNYAKLTITTTLLEGRKLLIIKDSFANCLIPMLTPYFSKIVVLDPRYMTEKVQNVLQEDDFTDIMFLYSANTFFADNSLNAVL